MHCKQKEGLNFLGLFYMRSPDLYVCSDLQTVCTSLSFSLFFVCVKDKDVKDTRPPEILSQRK